MIKPIVSMNQMAMNESIATTCCYKWNGVSITGMAQVLHGGELNVVTYYKNYYPETNNNIEVNGAWMNVGVVPNWDYKERVLGVENLPYLSGGEWYDGQEAITQFTGTALTDAGKVAWLLKTPAEYYKTVEDHKDIFHVGATSAHNKWGANNEWLVDHNAVQYNS